MKDSRRYFVSHTGIKLPFKPVNDLQVGEVENGNTFFLGYFDMTMLLFSAEGDEA